MSTSSQGEQLAVYLNDHLAGSVVAIGLLESLESAYAGTELATIAGAVRREIVEDRDVLTGLLSQVAGGESAPRKAAGWIAERLTQLKLVVDGGEHGPLRLLESTEVVSLGIEGKRGLWMALADVRERVPAFAALDFPRLVARAESQRERVEQLRLGAMRALVGER